MVKGSEWVALSPFTVETANIAPVGQLNVGKIGSNVVYSEPFTRKSTEVSTLYELSAKFDFSKATVGAATGFEIAKPSADKDGVFIGLVRGFTSYKLVCVEGENTVEREISLNPKDGIFNMAVVARYDNSIVVTVNGVEEKFSVGGTEGYWGVETPNGYTTSGQGALVDDLYFERAIYKASSASDLSVNFEGTKELEDEYGKYYEYYVPTKDWHFGSNVRLANYDFAENGYALFGNASPTSAFAPKTKYNDCIVRFNITLVGSDYYYDNPETYFDTPDGRGACDAECFGLQFGLDTYQNLYSNTQSLGIATYNGKSIYYDFDKSGFYGLCEVFGDMGGGVDPGITNEWIADMAGGLGVKSFRMWVSYGDLYSVDENDEIIVNQAKVAILRDAVDRLKAAGVENLLSLTTAFVYPKDYPTTTGYVVPDPYEEYDMYIRFLKIQQKAYMAFAKEFPEVNFYEPANEPEAGSCIHKNGYTHGGSEIINANYMYTQYDQVRIVADLCWYTTQAVQSVNPNAKVAIPGLMGLVTTPEYLEGIYEAIESSGLPVGQEKADVDPDNYFQILNWHPYTFGSDTVTEAWLQLQNDIYQVAIDHNDGGKPVWFTEFGWTDNGEPAYQQTIADGLIDFFDTVKAQMPYVQTVMVFRLTTLVTQDITLGENNFGIMYNKDDPVNGGKPKAAAIALAKYIRGENADLSILYKYVKEYHSLHLR